MKPLPRTIHRFVTVCSYVLTVVFCIVYWLAHRYVIPHPEVLTPPPGAAQIGGIGANMPIGMGGTIVATPTQLAPDDTVYEEVFGDRHYSNGHIDIRIETYEKGEGRDKLTYHAAFVTLDDISYLRSAFAHDTFGRNIIDSTSTIAANNNAILAINGDYFGFRDNGVEIRNGQLFRNKPTRTAAVIYRDGRMEFYDEAEIDAYELLSLGAVHTMSFGPVLVENGQAIKEFGIVNVDTNVGNGPIQNPNPRTVIGYYAPGEFVFVVVDGRSPGYSKGATLVELAQLMEELGVQLAYNLDGGGSSTMYFRGEVIGRPVGGKERGTSDIFHIGK